MNARSSEMLSLYTYTEESHVKEAVCLFAVAGLRKGKAVLLVMAEAHSEPVLEGLRNEGIDLEAVPKSAP